MLGGLLAAQAELERQIASLATAGIDPSILSECRAQQRSLAALQDSLATTPTDGLQALRGVVRRSVEAATTTVLQARTAADAATMAGGLSAGTGQSLRSELASLRADLFDRRIFDGFLRFDSEADEAEYRRREATARQYIDEQLAKNTRVGELNAGGAAMGQMLDAHAHGADESPEFASRWNRLVETTRRHREALRAEGQDTTEYDRRLQESVRRFLRAKGLGDAEIEVALAGGRDPLEAVRPFISDEREAKLIGAPTEWMSFLARTEVKHAVTTLRASSVEGDQETVLRQASAPSADDAMAAFRDAGIAVADTSTTSGSLPAIRAEAGRTGAAPSPR